MRRILASLLIALVAGGMPSLLLAQDGPEPGPGRERPRPADRKADSAAVDALVARMMAFDKNKDDKLTRDEITDERLLRMFDRADANKDGVVTREELVALAKRMVADDTASGRGGFGFPGGPGGFGPGGFGPGGPGGFGGPPRPGQILPPFLQQALDLSDDQKKQVAELQKEVDEKLDKILTDAQKQQLKDMRPRFGPPPRRGRRGAGDGPDANGRRPDGPSPGGPPESDR